MKRTSLSRVALTLVSCIALTIQLSASCAEVAHKSSVAKASNYKPSTVKAKKAPVRLRINVPCRAWVPRGVKPKVVLLCVHGLGLNSSSYENFGQRMSKAGVPTFAVDVRGFGDWIKMKGKNTVDFQSCLSDVEQALKTLHIAYPKCPVVLLGESMGGAIALRVAANRPDLVDGLISAVPSGDRFHSTKTSLKVALNVLTLRKIKRLNLGDAVLNDATDDIALKSAWKGDPLNRLNLSAKELWQFQRFMNENHETAKRINRTPVLFVVGMSDRLVKPEGSVELYEELATPNKKMMTILSAEHLVFEEGQCTAPVFSVVLDWLNHQSKGKKVSPNRKRPS